MQNVDGKQDAAELAQAMRQAMRGLAQSVAVISTRYQGARIAMAATAVNSLSLDPPSMMVAVNRSASIFAALRSGSVFCINILSLAQQDVAEACGGALKGDARFGLGDWDEMAGIPALMGAQSNLLCQQDGFVNYGSHGIFIGRVEEVRNPAPDGALLYADGRFCGLPRTQVSLSGKTSGC